MTFKDIPNTAKVVQVRAYLFLSVVVVVVVVVVLINRHNYA